MVITMMVLQKLFGCSENDIDGNGDHIIGDDEGDIMMMVMTILMVMVITVLVIMIMVITDSQC